MTVRVELLGRIALHGTRTASGGSLPGRRAELVFAYLAGEHHRVVSQDELADALWPEALPESWSAGLRGVVTEVRRFLEDAGLEPAEVLTTTRGGYRLQLPPDVVVDLDEARDELARARASLDAGDGAQAAVHGARSAELAQLSFLPNHDGDWVDGIRRELQSIHARALDVQVRGHRAAGDLAAAAAVAEQLVRADPFSEAGHQLRIRILGEAGDRAGAIKAYEHCRTVLAEELGVEPSAETEAALKAAVQAGAVRPPVPPTAPPATPEGSGPPGLADLSVLVIEDHDFQRRTALRLLRGLGVQSVSDAPDGVAALEILNGSPPPDVMVCDIDMPGMDGVQFIRRVAERGLASAVVIASGLDAKVLDAVKTIGEAHGLQVLGAIEKPLTARRLGELLVSYRRQPVRSPSDAEVSVTAEEVTAALAEGQMTTVFEPTVDLVDGLVSGAEAVGCWAHPTKGSIPPATFLPVLAAEGLLLRYAEAMLDDACTALSACRAAGLGIGIGLDVAPATLSDTALADDLADTVRRYGTEPSSVTWEVAEHTLPRAPPVALDAMTCLRVKGFGLALDNFGTRRPSPDRLARIPFTQVKIDGSLVGGGAARQPRLLLEETFDMAQSLAVPVVATGCESEADFDALVEIGVRYAQGPFVGRAMAGTELVEWAGNWEPPAPGTEAPR
jgi:EAL domain-containing protein (putative c-di-GMP-specific phosphodiesterase class I)/DNA-binding SARP family transcriptional activator